MAKRDVVIGGYGEILIEYHRSDGIGGAFIRVSGPGGSVALTGEPLRALLAATQLLGIEPSNAMILAIAAKLDWQLNGKYLAAAGVVLAPSAPGRERI